jgi:hypothetical protein
MFPAASFYNFPEWKGLLAVPLFGGAAFVCSWFVFV